MRQFIHDLRAELRGRPMLELVAIVYAVVPFVLGAVAIYSVFVQRPAIEKETMRNCQRSSAIANYIRTVVNASPDPDDPRIQPLQNLEIVLRSIGKCPR